MASHRACPLIAWLTAIFAAPLCQARAELPLVNLARFEWGGIPSAVSSAG